MAGKTSDLQEKIKFEPKSPQETNASNQLSRSSYETANLLSKCTCFFLWPLIRKANNPRKGLTVKDFENHAPTSCRLQKDHLDQLASEWNLEIAYQSIKKPSLTRAIYRTYRWRILLTSLIIVLSDCICEPLYFHYCIELIDTISRYPQSLLEESAAFNRSGSDNDDPVNSISIFGTNAITTELLSNAIMFSIFISGTPLIMQLYNWLISLTALGMRSSLAKLIYGKALRVDRSSSAINHKQAISLISKDIDSLGTNLSQLALVFTGPVECIVLTVLLTRSVGYETTCVSLLMSLTLCLIRGLLNVTQRSQLNSAFKLSDERGNLVNEAICAIRLLRMFAWTESIADRIELARSREMAKRRVSIILSAVDSTFFFVGSPAGAMITLAFGHYYIGLHISQAIVSEVFIVTVIHQRTLSKYVLTGIQGWINLAIVLDRIGQYLRADEVEDHRRLHPKSDLTSIGVAKTGQKKAVLQVDRISAGWAQDGSNSLSDISFSLQSDELMMICGRVGVGKSTLLLALLGELKISSGAIDLCGRVSYASQEPWIYSGTIRDNILFGAELDLDRYKRVLIACSLIEDLHSFPRLDLTEIGNRGATLSGGQKARINLARSLYRPAELYLFDDPLSAVDSRVARNIVQKALIGFLSDKAVILVTHQTQFLRFADKILTFSDAIDAKKSCCSVGTFDDLSKSDDIKINGHDSADETIEDNNVDRTKEEFVIQGIRESLTSNSPLNETDHLELTNLASKYRAWKAMKFYLNNSGTWFEHCLFLASNCAIRFFFLSSSTWLNLWAGVHQFNHYGFGETFIEGLHFDQALLIGVCLWSGSVVVTAFRSLQFYAMAMRGAKRIFSKLMRSILWARMSFLDLTPQGQLINRLTAYVNYMDTSHLQLINDLSVMSLNVLFMFFAVFCTDYRLTISIAICAFVACKVFTLFINFIIALKQVAGIKASAVYTHVSITLDGLSTIRASGRQNVFMARFGQLQDSHLSVLFLNLAIGGLIVIALHSTMVLFYTSLIGLDIVNTMHYHGQFAFLNLNLAALVSRASQVVFSQFVELYTRLQAINGIEDYCKVPPENGTLEYLMASDATSAVPLKANFAHAQVEFIGVSLRYHGTNEIVLRDLSFVINAREKVGIVGRTGAGKSSLISALFRLYHFEGFILIDGQDTKQLDLDSLRRSISIIPQDPVLFSGSLRHNLDPLNEYSDYAICKALEVVQLSKLATREQSGLEMDVGEAGSNLSVGQRQLICLARASLRRNQLLVLDEASANVDLETDRLIQRAIRVEFADCTVITVAHRLSSIIDSDRVMVMEGGRLCEFGRPSELIKAGGLFASMMASSGSESTLLDGETPSLAASDLSDKASTILHSTGPTWAKT